MESLRKKNTTKNQQSLDPFSMLPFDVIVMILLKLPAKCISRLNFVSQYLSSIICSKNFIDLYVAQSSTQPRILFMYNNNNQSQSLESRPQKDPTSDGYHKVNITLSPRGLHSCSPHVHGLICRRIGTKVMVGNPSTGQFITLPKIKTKTRRLYSFFGYDPVNNVYKVLCMTVARGNMSKEHQVFTLGPQQNWRKITCNHPYRPSSKTTGLCINGVLYYYASKNDEDIVLISFDLASEKFSAVELSVLYPEIQGPLVNYEGKIAIPCKRFMHHGPVNLWVLQDAEKHEWSVVYHSRCFWRRLVGTQEMYFQDILSTGEYVYAPCTLTPSDEPYFFLCHDPKDRSSQKVVVQGLESDFLINIWFDYVETPMILPNVS